MRKTFLAVISILFMFSISWALPPRLDDPVTTNEQEMTEFPDEFESESTSSNDLILDPGVYEVPNYKDLVINAKSCKCSSGCGMIKKGLSSKMRKYLKAAKAKGVSPISCVRPQYCQDRLRKCYNRCGMRGRAAKKSSHASGRACDFSRKYRSKLSSVRKKYGIRQLTHKRSHGGGLHHSH